MTIGLFLGSFNPIHIGHLIIANTVVTRHLVDQVWLIVTPQNPLKSSSDLLHVSDRLAMVSLAIAANDCLRACDIECKMSPPHYTIDTLTLLQTQYPRYSFIIIIGEDNLATFDQWKDHKKLLENYSLIVYPRFQSKEKKVNITHPHIKLIDAPLLGISASSIRKAIQERHSIKYLVPEEVEKYINRKKLYSVPSS
ncbi:MAG: nicotinate-nucleotide adenylyltransferase [Cytophagales bacterium]|nr:nicotinate-nucleotide adenylyltransferase [Cytophagales bacterium]